MRVLSVSWDERADVTNLNFNDAFKYSDWIVKADVLKDLIYDLTVHYETLLQIEEWEDRNNYNFPKVK
jgi:hypothetical protein